MDILKAKSRGLEKTMLGLVIPGSSEKGREPHLTDRGTARGRVPPLRNFAADITEDVKEVVVDKNSPIQK